MPTLLPRAPIGSIACIAVPGPTSSARPVAVPGHSFPFKGEVGRGMGEMHRIPHPRPLPPLEREGIHTVRTRDPQGSLKDLDCR